MIVDYPVIYHADIALQKNKPSTVRTFRTTHPFEITEVSEQDAPVQSICQFDNYDEQIYPIVVRVYNNELYYPLCIARDGLYPYEISDELKFLFEANNFSYQNNLCYRPLNIGELPKICEEWLDITSYTPNMTCVEPKEHFSIKAENDLNEERYASRIISDSKNKDLANQQKDIDENIIIVDGILYRKNLDISLYSGRDEGGELYISLFMNIDKSYKPVLTYPYVKEFIEYTQKTEGEVLNDAIFKYVELIDPEPYCDWNRLYHDILKFMNPISKHYNSKHVTIKDMLTKNGHNLIFVESYKEYGDKVVTNREQLVKTIETLLPLYRNTTFYKEYKISHILRKRYIQGYIDAIYKPLATRIVIA